jgi:hypothetical protein
VGKEYKEQSVEDNPSYMVDGASELPLSQLRGIPGARHADRSLALGFLCELCRAKF